MKISSASVDERTASSPVTGNDSVYNDLMDWAKSRKRQFLRNRVQRSGETPQRAIAPQDTDPSTDDWIETWYNPPKLPSRIARQRAIASYTPGAEVAKGTVSEVVDIRGKDQVKVSSQSVSQAAADSPEELHRSLEPEISVIHPVVPDHPSGFEVGQPVVLRPGVSNIPAGIPADAVLIVQEMCFNVYRQHQNIWCVWCQSDAFSGLKSIDSDCLMSFPKVVQSHEQSVIAEAPVDGSALSKTLATSSALTYTREHPTVADLPSSPNPFSQREKGSRIEVPLPAGEGFRVRATKGRCSPYKLVEDGSQLDAVLKPLGNCQAIAIDTETTGLDPLKDRIRLVQIAAEHHPVIIIDLFKVQKDALTPLRELLQGTSVKVLQNAKFDLKFLHQAGLPIGGKLFDTMLAAQLLDAGVRSHSYNLAELARVYLGEDLPKEQQRSDWSNPQLSPEQLEYAARDAAILLRLREVMKPRLKNARLVDTAKLEFDCLEPIAQMELNGMLLDLSRWEVLRQELEKKRNQLADGLRQQLEPALLNAQLDFLGHEALLNLDSQQQVLDALQQLGVPVENTSKLSLIPLAEEHPPVRALLDYRKAAKAVQAFASSLPKHVHPITGRIHPDYQQIGAATGRMSCRNPNLQQIPRDKIFRSCFIPAPGYRLVVADYSQIELRVAAELSGDRRMIEAYQNDEDLHQLTAALIAEKSLDQVEKAERQAAKAVNFGLIYAMGAKGLAEYAYNNYGVQMSLKQAETFRKRYFEAYQGIARWHNAIRKKLPREMRTMGVACSPQSGGRLRRWREEPKLTELLNTPVQGTSADITKAALARLPFALRETEAKVIGTIHDEILLEAPEGTAERAAQVLQQVMEQAGQQYLRKVPVKAEVAIVGSWSEK